MYADDVDSSKTTRKNSGSEGKWKHDKFFETERKGNQAQRTGNRGAGINSGRWQHDKFNDNVLTSELRREPKAPLGGGAKRVNKGPATLFISNLAPSVVQEDLEELFGAYDASEIVLQYDAAGNSLGTANIVVPGPVVANIKEEFKNVCLDGNQMKILETTAGAAAPSTSVFDRISKVPRRSGDTFKATRPARSNGGGGSSGSGARFLDRNSPERGNRSRSGPARGSGGGGGARNAGGRGGGDRKSKKTVEQLDAELDAYMKQ